MPPTYVTPNITYIKDGDGNNHAIDALFLEGHSYNDILETVAAAGFKTLVTTTMPVAGPTYSKTLLLLPDPDDQETGNKLEYLCIQNGTSWGWEPIGTTRIKFTGATTNSAGAHTHSIGAATYKYFTTRNLPSAFSALTVPLTFNTTSIVATNGTGSAVTSLTTTGVTVLKALNTITKSTFVTEVTKTSDNFVKSVSTNKLDRTTVYSAGATVSVFNGATVDSDGVLSFSTTGAVGSRTAATVAIGTVSSAGTGATVATGSSSGSVITTVGGSTAEAATDISFTNATALSNVTGATQAFAKAASGGITVMTGVATTATPYVGSATTAAVLTGTTATSTTGSIRYIDAVSTVTGSAGAHTHSVSLS